MMSKESNVFVNKFHNIKERNGFVKKFHNIDQPQRLFRNKKFKKLMSC